MTSRKREIFIKVDKVSQIIDLLQEVKSQEKILKNLFYNYDKLNLDENKIFENWSYYLEDMVQKLDHVTM